MEQKLGQIDSHRESHDEYEVLEICDINYGHQQATETKGTIL